MLYSTIILDFLLFAEERKKGLLNQTYSTARKPREGKAWETTREKKHKLMFSRAHENSLRCKKFLMVCCDVLLLYVFHISLRF